VDAAFEADEDSEIGGGGTGSALRGIQDGFGSESNGPTLALSDPLERIFRKKHRSAANYCITWTCTDDGALRDR